MQIFAYCFLLLTSSESQLAIQFALICDHGLIEKIAASFKPRIYAVHKLQAVIFYVSYGLFRSFHPWIKDMHKENRQTNRQTAINNRLQECLTINAQQCYCMTRHVDLARHIQWLLTSIISAFSSVVNKFGTSAELSRASTSSRKDSSLIWLSVMRNAVFLFDKPVVFNRLFMSSRHSFLPYCFEISGWKTCIPDMNAARRVRDCRPLPPTPTSRAFPPAMRSTRLIRDRCSNTYLHMTGAVVVWSSASQFDRSSSLHVGVLEPIMTHQHAYTRNSRVTVLFQNRNSSPVLGQILWPKYLNTLWNTSLCTVLNTFKYFKYF